jgi:hypothetical protein
MINAVGEPFQDCIGNCCFAGSGAAGNADNKGVHERQYLVKEA